MKQSFIRYCILLLLLLCKVTAVADVNPPNPPEPQIGLETYALNVICEPARAGYCSGSGKYTIGQKVLINTSGNAGYVLDHWTLNGVLYEETNSMFDYVTIGRKDQFVAHYRYEPENPSEPSLFSKARLYFTCSPDGVASFSRTSGQLVQIGSVISIDVYPNQGYKFLGWYANGELVSDKQNMSYTMPSENTSLIARFVYAPTNPVEPDSSGQTDVDLTPSEELPGDLNGDDEMDEIDVRYLVKILLGQQDEIEAADVNSSGHISMADVTALIELLKRGSTPSIAQ